MAEFISQTTSIQEKQLFFPVKNGAEKVIFQLWRGEQMLREFDVELALEGEPDWWAQADTSAFSGEVLTLKANAALPPGLIRQEAPEGAAAADLYHERLRPQFHFTPRRGWNNDPNGLVLLDGVWHLFFQHNPFGVNWGNMHWGHAVSRDLCHWQELPLALFPKSLSDMAFSGCALVDQGNSAGFAPAGETALVAAFTSTGRGQCLAYSLDGGATLQEYAHNPVIPYLETGSNQNRDPKIIRYAEHWVMIVYEEVPAPGGEWERGYAIYTSLDLKNWKRTDFLPGWFECPELFELELEGKPVWVIHGCLWQGARSAFLLGDFDGQTFTPRAGPFAAHNGPAFYAAQNFNNTAGRVIMLGWLAGAAYPEMPFSQGMTVPLELSLRPGAGGAPQLCFNPVAEFESLRHNTIRALNLNFEQVNWLLQDMGAELVDVELGLEAQDLLRVEFGEQVLECDFAQGELRFGDTQSGLSRAAFTLQEGRLELRLLVDRGVVEVFAQGGAVAFAARNLRPEGQPVVKLAGEGKVKKLGLHTLKSIWD